MTTEIKVPMLPESIADATIATWHKKVGDSVSRDENLMDLETDKVMLEVPSPIDGILKEIIKKSGDVVSANEVVAIVEAGSAAKSTAEKDTAKTAPAVEKEPAKAASQKSETAAPTKTASPKSEMAESTRTTSSDLSPSVRRALAERDLDASQLQGTGKTARLTKENLETSLSRESANIATHDLSGRPEKRVPMTRIRARIAERLLEVRQNTAMLTTFNEINLQQVIDLRNKYKDKFEKSHQSRLGFMSFFVKAAVEALKRYPIINASIDGNDIVYHGYFDIGVAVSTERGLVVPILRNADKMSMAEIEASIADYANKARNGKLTMEDMQGGTFTITNGGVFGSLLSTPILNSPQSAILGMHKIDQRAVVENGQIVIRPMMYVAMSYDHRIIDGKDSVGFVVTIKEMLEDPARLLLEV
jgi:2-oxoglutarate dehydrogenase E2 component (dihydrolipoamide succinyltransferase)